MEIIKLSHKTSYGSIFLVGTTQDNKDIDLAEMLVDIEGSSLDGGYTNYEEAKKFAEIICQQFNNN